MDLRLDGWRQNQLSDPRPALHDEWRAAKIYEKDLQLTAIIGVEGAWGIEHRNPKVQREPGARPDLALDPSGERECEASWNRRTPSRCDDDRRFGHVCGYRGDEVEAGRMRAGAV